jgi:hypothetical protein
MDILLQWLPTLICVGTLILAIIKSPNERASLNGDTVRNYAEAARIAGEEAQRAREEAQAARTHSLELESRFETMERKRYHITVDFEIGDPPKAGIVKIEPILPNVQKKAATHG